MHLKVEYRIISLFLSCRCCCNQCVFPLLKFLYCIDTKKDRKFDVTGNLMVCECIYIFYEGLSVKTPIQGHYICLHVSVFVCLSFLVLLCFNAILT